MHDPQTMSEWQEAVNAAQGCLASEFIRALGLIENGPMVDVARCTRMIEEGSSRGITPSEAAVREWLLGTSHELEAERVYRVFLKAHEMSGHPELSVIVPVLAGATGRMFG